jgi:hypothetical protein
VNGGLQPWVGGWLLKAFSGPLMVCTEQPLIRWLQWWTTEQKRDSLVFGFSMQLWSRKLREACNWLNIGNLGYTLSSFRSGGATYQFRSHGNLEERADFAVLYPGINLFNATSFVTEQGKQRASAIREGVRWLEAPPLAPCASLVCVI